ncbi:hypothetical protein V0U79_01820 [Hyphobacterium sp. HN65]|uniref:HEAT repeat domain-containing protein n=1 Tax=Hyphobacterium lacteum TaxID=3116575 RepID=A0ABU7LMD2_9PROT|nr:hypothetical protein [Hyphobacterium sp. HN65]MEE2525086.1 hypothetical protein [Hyphobacterium sp. HN65]
MAAAVDGLAGDLSRPGLIPLYSGENVSIFAHLWADAADRLHQHDWFGAFQVIEGRSFNARFAFRQEGTLEEFGLGQLDRTGLEIFTQGHIQPVTAGDGLIHSVVYSGKPGLAVSLRVASENPAGAMEYLRPGLRCPSYRRRGNSAAQLDLLAQARQLGDDVYAERFMGMAGQLDDAGLLRLLDAAAFDGLELPDPVVDLAAGALPGGMKTLASLDDIERSDKTRELLSEHQVPVVRDVICAIFHSDGRGELAEALRIAGHGEPVLAAGEGLAALLIDDQGNNGAPEALLQALGEAALTGDLATAMVAMREKEKGADHVDAHFEFLEMAFSAMEETPFFRCLFRA